MRGGSYLFPIIPPVERPVVSKILDLGNGMIQIDGLIVDKALYSIMEKVKEYDPNLEVMYCDPNRAEPFDAPWVIVERCNDGLYRRVFEVWDLNESVLERIYNADTRVSLTFSTGWSSITPEDSSRPGTSLSGRTRRN